jgi:hypothetical protein
MLPRSKKDKKIVNLHLSREQFLGEHNRLSPQNLKATIPLLSRFRIEKASLFKDNTWVVDKIRRPFIIWLTSLDLGKKKKINYEK